jgi:hypothetical protein
MSPKTSSAAPLVLAEELATPEVASPLALVTAADEGVLAPPRAEPRLFGLSVSAELALVCACLALFVVLTVVRGLDHPIPYWDDVGFLDLGNQVRELGGPWALTKALFQGRWLEDNRNPLYPALLSLVAGRDRGYHGRAQLLTLGVALLALLACWSVARRQLGSKAALVFLTFLCASETLVQYTGRESTEPLLILLWALAVGAILEGEKRPALWLWAGFLTGLAQLAKGNALLLVGSFGLALLWTRGLKALKDLYAWGYGAFFVLAASPLFVRNARIYGSPLYHSNSRLLWVDRLPDYSETYAPHGFDRLPHHISFERIYMGIAEVLVHLGDAMSFVAPAPLRAVHIPGVVLGFALLVITVRTLTKHQARSLARSLLLTQFWVFAVFFGLIFTAAGGSSRYVFPMVICLYAALAKGLVDRARTRWLPAWLGVGALCVILALALDRWPREIPPDFEAMEQWLSRNLKAGDVYAVDSRSHLEPEWFLPKETQMLIASSAWQKKPLTPSELSDYFHQKQVRYVLLDASSNQEGPARYFFYDRIPLEAGRLVFDAVPSGFHLVWSDPSRRWAVLAVD